MDEAKKRIKNKNGLLYLFAESERITAHALTLSVSISQIKTLFDRLFKKFGQSDDPAIQTVVAGTMLDYGFVLDMYADKARERAEKTEDKYERQKLLENHKKLAAESSKIFFNVIETYSSPKYADNIYIQRIVAKCRSNVAVDSYRASIDASKKVSDDLQKIINDYIGSDDDGLKIQVARAILNKATNLHSTHLTQATKEKVNTPYQEEKIGLEEVIAEYDLLISRFIESTTYEVMHKVLSSMMQKIELYKYHEKTDEQLAVYDAIIERFENYSDKFFGFSAADVMKKKVELLFKIERYEEALQQYGQLEMKAAAEPDGVCCFSLVFIVLNAELPKTKIEAKIREKEQRKEKEKTTQEVGVLRDMLNSRMEDVYKFYPANKANLKLLVDRLAHGQIIPFVGAGLSHIELDKSKNEYAYPLWSEFVSSIYKKYIDFDPKDPKREQLFEENNLIPEKLKDPRKRLYEFAEDVEEEDRKPFFKRGFIDQASFLDEQLGRALFGLEISEAFEHQKFSTAHNLLKDQPHSLFPDLFDNRLILTTNFDNLIELAYQCKDALLVSYSSADEKKFEDTNKNAKILYHLHGSIDQPAGIVLTKENYGEHYDPEGANVKILNKYLSGNNVLFIGCSLEEDKELETFFERGQNFALFPSTYEMREENEKRLSGHNVIPILFEFPNFDLIKVILHHCLFEVWENRLEDLKKKMGHVDFSGIKRWQNGNIGTSQTSYQTLMSSTSDNVPLFHDINWTSVDPK